MGNEKGFGFITPDDGGEDLFCHVSSLLDGEGSIREGEKCKFDIEFDDRKGKDHATRVEYAGSGKRRSSRSRSRSRGGGGRGGGGRRGRQDNSRDRGRKRDNSRSRNRDDSR